MILYYKILSENNKLYISKEELLKKGITSNTKSNFGSKVGLGNRHVNGTPFDQQIDKPEWLDFNKAIPCSLKRIGGGKYLGVKIFTDKIMVFNKDIASDIVDQEYYILLEDDEERYAFDTGKTIEELYASYWNSMSLMEDYIKNKPYPNPEIFIFDDISPKYLYGID